MELVAEQSKLKRLEQVHALRRLMRVIERTASGLLRRLMVGQRAEGAPQKQSQTVSVVRE